VVNSEEYLRGIAFFNRADFFDAHEALEDVWRAAPIGEKKFLQGLIQAAVAFHHYSTGNRIGMRSVLERSLRNLSAYGEGFGGIQLAALRESLRAWLDAVDGNVELPALPQIQRRDI